MKNTFTTILAASFILGLSSVASANPFSDVPSSHWSYEAVQNLQKSGIVSGYSDNTFKGDKTITRYEMAKIISTSIKNIEKADKEQKATLEMLYAEFADEFRSIDSRFIALEKKQSNVKFGGHIRHKVEYGDYQGNNKSEPGDNTHAKTRIRLKMDASLDDNWSFTGRFHNETDAGKKTTNTEPALDQGYLTGTWGQQQISIGRQGVSIGQNLIADCTGYWDGIKLSNTSDKFFISAAYLKREEPLFDANKVANNNIYTANGTYNYSYYIAEARANISPNFVATASYLADKDGTNYDSYAVGFKHKGLIKNMTFTGEYGENNSEWAKIVNNNQGATAWFIEAKYRGASLKEKGTWGTWVTYRDGDKGFDPFAYTLCTLFNGQSAPTSCIDDMKGLEFGVDYTLFKNGLLTVKYLSNEEKSTKEDVKKFVTEINYFF